MVIYDTEKKYINKTSGVPSEIRGILYLNIYDIDYLVSKYSIEELKELIPNDYVKEFEDGLFIISTQDKLSQEYFSIIPLPIETDEDETLLDIIRKEVDEGNMFTKKQLKHLTKEQIDEVNCQNINLISYEELYKIRSYKMLRYILKISTIANEYMKIRYENVTYYNSINETRFKSAENEHKKCLKDLEVVGFSSSIIESDYFERPKLINPKLVKNINN